MSIKNKKFTKESINKDLAQREITLLGDPSSSRASTLFRCSLGHEWQNSIYAILGGQGCGVCANAKRAKTKTLSREVIAERISHTGIKIIGEYVNTKTKTLFRCDKGHEWSTTSNHILQGQGCPTCIGQFKRTKEMVNKQIESRGIELVGEYIHTHHKSLFRCSLGHSWMASSRSVIAGNGCPSCATHGYDPLKPAHVYLIDFGSFIKYGITTDLNTRLQSHTRTTGTHRLLVAKLYDSGSDALRCESEIRKQFGGNFVTKSEMKNGWTETLHSSLLEEVQRFIEEY